MKIIFLSLVLSLKLFSNNELNLLEVSYISFMNTKKINEAYSVLKKIIEIKPNDEKWIKEFINLSFWTGDYVNWINFLKRISIEQIPENQYNAIKIYAPELYLNILLNKLKKNYKKDYAYEAINISLKIGKIDLLKDLLKKYLKNFEENEKKEIAEKFILTDIIYLIIEYSNLFDNQTRCKLISEYSKNLFFKDKKSSMKILKQNQKSCENSKSFISTYIDLAKNLSDYETYFKLLEISYKNDTFRVQDAEDLISLNNNNKELVRKISIKAYQKFKLKHFLYYYLSTNPKDIKEELEDLDDEIKLYFSIINFENLKIKEKKETLDKIKALIKTNLLPNSYIWIITEKLDFKSKEDISPLLNCKNFNNEEEIRAITYFKSSINQINDAIQCFEKIPARTVTDTYLLSELYLSNGNFVESYFYKRKAYDIYKKNNFYIQPRQKIEAMLLFEPNKFFVNEITKNEINKEEKDILLSEFYNTFLLTEKIKTQISTSTFYNIYYRNKENFIYNIEENLSPELYISYYSTIKDVPNTFNWLYYKVNNNSQNLYTYLSLKSNIERFKNFKKISYIFSSDKFVEKNSINLDIQLSQRFEAKSYYSRFNLINTKVFSERKKEEKSISLKTYYNDNSIELSYTQWLRSFFSIRYLYFIDIKRLTTEFDLAISQKALSTTLSNIILLEDYSKLFFSIKHNSKSKTILSLLFSNYKDMNNNYFATSKTFQLEHQAKYRNIYFSPYSRYVFYNSKEKKQIAYNNIFKTQQKILPDEFFEFGTTTTFLFKNLNISLIQSYNNKNNFNYGLFLTLTKNLRKASNLEIEISHFKNYENSNSQNTTIQLYYKF